MKGYTHRNNYHLYPKFLDLVLPYIREKKMVFVEDIVEGLECGPTALVGLFSGRMNVVCTIVSYYHPSLTYGRLFLRARDQVILLGCG